jgi:hypothetical protein
VLVVFLCMSTSNRLCLCLRVMVRSKKSMDLCFSYVGLSLMLLCILFMYVLMVCEQVLVSYMIKKISTFDHSDHN